MKRIGILWMTALVLLCGTVVVGCKGRKTDTKPVKGVLEEPVKEGSAPGRVDYVLKRHVIDGNFENILNDTAAKVSVWSLVRCDDESLSDGFGIVVVKEGRATIFSDIRHGNNPMASYDAATDCLWLAGVSIEGTGVHVERLYQIRFSKDGPASIDATIDPYEMQQALCDELRYSVEGEQITLYGGEKEPVTVTNTVKDMGGFYEDAVWLGEQISYQFRNDSVFVHATPGVSFVVGKVLHYDDMPTVTANVTIRNDGGFSLSKVALQ